MIETWSRIIRACWPESQRTQGDAIPLAGVLSSAGEPRGRRWVLLILLYLPPFLSFPSRMVIFEKLLILGLIMFPSSLERDYLHVFMSLIT